MLVTVISFLITRWIGKRCNVWTTGLAIMSLIPFFQYIVLVLIFTNAIENLNKRIKELEQK
jgi:transposase-like protein